MVKINSKSNERTEGLTEIALLNQKFDLLQSMSVHKYVKGIGWRSCNYTNKT